MNLTIGKEKRFKNTGGGGEIRKRSPETHETISCIPVYVPKESKQREKWVKSSEESMAKSF